METDLHRRKGKLVEPEPEDQDQNTIRSEQESIDSPQLDDDGFYKMNIHSKNLMSNSNYSFLLLYITKLPNYLNTNFI